MMLQNLMLLTSAISLFLTKIFFYLRFCSFFLRLSTFIKNNTYTCVRKKSYNNPSNKLQHSENSKQKKHHMRPGATKGTLRRENKNLFFDELCLITFHWSF